MAMVVSGSASRLQTAMLTGNVVQEGQKIRSCRVPVSNILRPCPARSYVKRNGPVKAVRCGLAQALETARQKVGPAAAAALSAALLTVGQPQVAFAERVWGPVNVCDVAEVPPLVIPGARTGPPGAEGEQLMMQGMTVPGFDPRRYAGRWFEVASLKQGFAGQGQEDCHCTQGVYSFDEARRQINVDTFCVHGSPTGYMTGIRGSVSCVKVSTRDAQYGRRFLDCPQSGVSSSNNTNRRSREEQQSSTYRSARPKSLTERHVANTAS